MSEAGERALKTLMDQLLPMLATSIATVLRQRGLRDDGGDLVRELSRNGLAPIAMLIEPMFEELAATRPVVDELIEAIDRVWRDVDEGHLKVVHYATDINDDCSDIPCPEDETCACQGRSTFTKLQAAQDKAKELAK